MRDWTDVAGRVGLATQAALYLMVAALALQVAGGDQEQADQHGAIGAVARQAQGKWLLVALIAGLCLHALWRFSLAWRGQDEDEPAKSLALRLANVGRGAIYVGLAISAIRVLVGAGGNGGGGEREKQATATVLEWPGGRVLVIGAGLAVIGAGLWQFRQPITRSFAEKLRFGANTTARRVATIVGSIGFAARGVVFGMVGSFLVRAALDYDPQEAKGIDEAFDELVASSNGPVLLRMVAAGLMAFGVFRLLDAWYRADSET